MSEDSKRLFEEIIRVIGVARSKDRASPDDIRLVVDRLFCTREMVINECEKLIRGRQSLSLNHAVNRFVRVVGMGRVTDASAQPHCARAT